jgi:gamma-glutamylcyclotransferase (GGCT)/AIG2-like uncharacterized protein YtfP
MSKQLLFVYGTLKRGFGNNLLLRNAEFVGEATTVESDAFVMLTNGRFPAVHRGIGHAVSGELYRVAPEELRRVDELENHPDWYVRQEVETTGGKAWMYFLRPEGSYWRTVEPVNGVLKFTREEK